MATDLKTLSKNFNFEAKSTYNEDIQTSCLMRIADATEMMAQNYARLLKELEDANSRTNQHKRLFNEERIEKEALQRSITAHKANYTRLKRKLGATNAKI